MQKISEYDLEMKIWEVHWKLHELERRDEDPRQYEEKLNPGSSKGSQDPSDYRFGLTEEEIDNYVILVDLHHALTLLRYGSSKLYPYLMKRVDVFPIMLRDLPFHSIRCFVVVQKVEKGHTTCISVCILAIHQEGEAGRIKIPS